jgi:hypothetical protein
MDPHDDPRLGLSGSTLSTNECDHRHLRGRTIPAERKVLAVPVNPVRRSRD